jgi:hypothetical protein
MMAGPRLPALGLSLQRYTADVPDDGYWYLLRGDEQLGRHRTEKAGRAAWQEYIAGSGWEPPQRELDPAEALQRDISAREHARYVEYWSSSHKFRRGGMFKGR